MGMCAARWFRPLVETPKTDDQVIFCKNPRSIHHIMIIGAYLVIKKRFPRDLKNWLPLDSNRTLIWHCLLWEAAPPNHLLSPSGDLGIGLVWDNRTTGPHRTDFLVPLLKSSSNWTKSSMMGPQLFLGWYQMILDVQTRFRLGSD